MLIENLEKKTRLALTTVVLTIISSLVVNIYVINKSYSKIAQEQSQIYVLDGSIPFLAERAKQEANFAMEAKAQIQLFHQYFFTLPPDDRYIQWSLGKALYLADESAVRQKKAMEASGFFSDLLSSSSTCMITCDSIHLNEQDKTFTYYGTEYIKRHQKQLRRSLITSGKLEIVPRTRNNSHGLLITDWKTLENKDLRN